MKRGFLNNENGLSLLEVVVSLLLISIILISFYGMFIQSKKTNRSAEATADATYLAQSEMEKVFQLSTTLSLNQLDSSSIPGYTVKEKNNFTTCRKSSGNIENKLIYNSYSSEITYEKIMNRNYTSVITIKQLCDFENSATVIIEMIDQNQRKKAILENVYVWKNN